MLVKICVAGQPLFDNKFFGFVWFWAGGVIFLISFAYFVIRVLLQCGVFISNKLYWLKIHECNVFLMCLCTLTWEM